MIVINCVIPIVQRFSNVFQLFRWFNSFFSAGGLTWKLQKKNWSILYVRSYVFGVFRTFFIIPKNQVLETKTIYELHVVPTLVNLFEFNFFFMKTPLSGKVNLHDNIQTSNIPYYNVCNCETSENLQLMV